MFDWQKIEQIKSTTLSELVAKKLYDCMMDAPTNQALEFGSYLGKSAVTIGAAAKEREGTLL